MLDNKGADRLICLLARGDTSALETLYTELAPSVYAFARSIVRNDDIAQDIMQDTFVRVFNSAVAFKPQGYGKAWIMQIARNLALNAISTQRMTGADEEMENLPAADSTADDTEARLMISLALDSLTDAEREVVVLHAVSGLKLQRIAEIMNEPLGTVKWRHSQAMKKIKAVMVAGEEVAL